MDESAMQTEIDNFTQMVHEAFGESIYPGDDQLVRSRNYETEEVNILSHFKGKRWQELSLEALIANRDNMYRLTIAAFRYYIPAYMIATIAHFHYVDVLSNNTLYHLTPPENHETWKENLLMIAKGFTEPQRTAIQAFITLYARLAPEMLVYDPGRHLQRAAEFWSKSITDAS